MNNLFKKGFASLALASAMTSSIFAGSAAYLDVKVNYLSGMDGAVLGAADSKKERVELLVAVLDADGNYATKDDKNIDDIVALNIRRGTGTSKPAQVFDITTDGTATGINRAVVANSNIQRIILDYSDGTFDKLSDTLTISSGDLKRDVAINLISVEAKGLLIRATTKTEMRDASDSTKVLNELFSKIKITDDNNLSLQSSRAPGGAAGIKIPLIVYATVDAPKSIGDVSNSRFTYAPNLNKAIIVVDAVADYNGDGEANVSVGTIELEPMENGIAKGVMTLTAGLPVGHGSDDKFETALIDGLGIAFIAYVKDDMSIANKNDLDADDRDTFSLNGDNNDTDSVQIKSLDATNVKVGTFNLTGTDTGDWTNTKTTFSLVDANQSDVYNDTNGSIFQAFTVTAVDMYDNPALGYQGGAKIKGEAVFNGSSDSDDKSAYFDVNITEMNITSATNRLSVATVTVIDGTEKNGSTSQKLTISYNNNELSAASPLVVTVNSVELIKPTMKGSTVLIDSIESAIALPVMKIAKAVDKDKVSFTIVAKGVPQTGNNNVLITIPDPDRAGDFFGNSQFEIEQNGTDLSYVNDKNGWEANITNTTDNNYTLVFKDKRDSDTQTVALLTFKSSYAQAVVVSNSAKITFNALDRDRVPAYYSATFVNERDEYKLSVGKTIDFVFSGSAVSVGDSVTIDFDGTAGHINVGLLDGDVPSPKKTSLTTTIPADKIVKVQLFDVNQTSNSVLLTSQTSNSVSGVSEYGILKVSLNGDMIVSNLNGRDNDKDTRGIVELDSSKMITVSALEVANTAKLTLSGLPATESHTATSGDEGETDRWIVLIPNGGTDAAKNKTISGKVTIGAEVKTNTYYRLFDENYNLTLSDNYKNKVALRDADIDRNYVLTATDGTTVDINRGATDASPAYVKFSDSTVGTTQTVTVTSTDGNISQTITFTNITKATQNKELNISFDSGSKNFNVMNSEIVIKVIGDGNTAQDETTLMFKHSAGGTIRLVPIVAGAGKGYDSILGDNKAVEAIAASGNYYIVSTDKAGTIEVSATATISRDDSKTNAEVKLTSNTAMFTFDNIDLDDPLVTKADVVKDDGSITVTIQDKNLDIVKTTVKIYTINDLFVKDATYTNGKYMASGLSPKAYSVRIEAIDYAHNKANYSFIRILGAGVATLEDSLIAHGPYVIDGKFASHDFEDANEEFDWAYARGDVVYQLNSKKPIGKSAFKWGIVTGVTVGNTNAWSMIKLTGSDDDVDAEGAYGWVLVNAKGDTFKLVGANDDGTFKFSKALYVKGTMSGSNISFAKR